MPEFPTSKDLSNSKSSSASRFEKMVAAYVAVAGAAAGVALLAAPAAEAKVVFTPAHKAVNSALQIDLNHDGIADFTLEFCECLPHARIFQVGLGVTGNMVRSEPPDLVEAAALLRGSPVGPNQQFTSDTSGYGGVFMADAGTYGSIVYSNGPWLNAPNRYLGFKFLIAGQVHYGWARVTSTDRLENVVLTGYAYETVPNKHIETGQTSDGAGADAWLSDPAPQGPSLGQLACGAVTLEIWRRSPLAA